MPFFNSNNIERHLFSAYTNISSASTFNAIINPFLNSFKSTRWEYPDGHSQTTGVTHYNIPGSGSRLVKAYVNRESNIQLYNLENLNLVGGIKLFENNDVLVSQPESSYIEFSSNPGLNKISFPSRSNRLVRWFNAASCSLSGQVDLSMFHISGLTNENTTLSFSNNAGINSIVLSNEVSKNYITNILIDGCSIGTPYVPILPGTVNWNTTVDLTIFPNINGTVYLTNGNFPNGNSAITYVNFATMTGGTINLTMNGLPFYTGNSYNLDMSFANGNMGQNFIFSNLPQITGFTYHSPETNYINKFDMSFCNLQNNLDFSNYYGMGGNLSLQNNTGLTAITFTTHQKNGFSQLNLIGTGIYNLDLSNFYDIGDYLCQIAGCPNLTGLTLPNNLDGGSGIYQLNFGNCNYIDLDFSYTHLAHPYGTILTLQDNHNLTGFTFPFEGVNTNGGNFYNYMFFEGCNIKKFSIENVSGFNHNVLQIRLNDNSMTADIVNEMLVKIDNTGWSGNSLSIGGNNAAPDTTSGGYNGVAAYHNLTGKNWTVSIT